MSGEEQENLVSVVIPIYKQESAYFISLLQSIRTQTFRQYEIIISDDNPGDEIHLILDQFRDLPIKYIENKSATKGIFSNLNNAIANARGEFIQIFCQDDIMFDEFLSEQLAVIKKYDDAGMVFAEFKVIDDANKIFPLESRYDMRLKWPENISKSNTINYLFAYGCMPGNLSPVMFKAKVIKEAGLFDQHFSYAGDFEYWSRIAGKFSFCFNKNPALAIRRHAQQSSAVIGIEQWMKDTIAIYSFLLTRVSINRSKAYLKLYFNQHIGRQYTYNIVKGFFTGKFKSIRLLKYFSHKPFNFFSSFFFLIVTLNGKFELLKLNERDFK